MRPRDLGAVGHDGLRHTSRALRGLAPREIPVEGWHLWAVARLLVPLESLAFRYTTGPASGTPINLQISHPVTDTLSQCLLQPIPSISRISWMAN